MGSILELFLIFLKIGITTFGGGYAMISNVKEEIVDKKKWITNEELLNLLAVAESTPGPIAINMATFVGYKKNKTLGAIAATIGVIIPSFIVILALTYLFNAFMSNLYVKYAFYGIKAAVVLLIIKAGINLLKEVKLNFLQIILFTLSFVLSLIINIFSLDISVLYLLLAGGFFGLTYYLIFKNKKETNYSK